MRNYNIEEYELYTDGSCVPSIANSYVNYGGWAYYLVKDSNVIAHDKGQILKGATNQRAELIACAEGLKRAKILRHHNERVKVFSDSAYLINCYLQGWYKNWMKNGWVNSKGDDVANRELWWELIPFFQDVNYFFEKVKGHADNYYNNLCDKDAQEMARDARSGKIVFR